MKSILILLFVAFLSVNVGGAKKDDDDYDYKDDDYDYDDDDKEPDTLPPTKPTPAPVTPSSTSSSASPSSSTSKTPSSSSSASPSSSSSASPSSSSSARPSSSSSARPSSSSSASPSSSSSARPSSSTSASPSSSSSASPSSSQSPSPSSSTASPTSQLLERCKLAHPSDNIQSVQGENSCIFQCVGIRRNYRHRKDNGATCDNGVCVRGKCKSVTQETLEACKTLLKDQKAYGVRGRSNQCAVFCAKGTDRLRRYPMPSSTVCNKRRTTGHCQNFRCRK